MLVVKVLSPHSPRESFTVLGDDDVPVAPVERYLKYLTAIERSPNRIKAYAHDLKDWFTFLAGRDREWQSVTVEDVGAFVAWLRLPKTLRQDGIGVLPSADHHCGEATVNRKLSALAAFYLHAVREGVDVGELLTTWQIGGSRAGWKPFLHHISNACAANSHRHSADPATTASASQPAIAIRQQIRPTEWPHKHNHSYLMDTVHHTKPQTTDPAGRRTTDNDRTAQQGDQTPRRRRRDLPQPGCVPPARDRSGHRSARRVASDPTLRLGCQHGRTEKGHRRQSPRSRHGHRIVGQKTPNRLIFNMTR